MSQSAPDLSRPSATYSQADFLDFDQCAAAGLWFYSVILPGNRVFLDGIWWPGEYVSRPPYFLPPTMPLQNRVDPFGDLFASSARGLLMGNRGGRFHDRREKADSPPLGVAAVDLLRPRFQRTPARCLGPLLHRIVLPRRGDGARRRSPALLRMPAQGRGRFRRAVSGRDARRAPTWTTSLHAERLDGKVKRLHRRKIDALARRRDYRA